VASVLEDHFFVECIWVPVWRALEAKRGTVLEISGTLPNLEIAEYVWHFLDETAERLWREHKRTRRIRGNRDRRAFRAGVVAGFKTKLDREKKASDAEGLVWIGDGDLDDFFRKRHPKVHRVRYSGYAPSAARMHGRVAGEQVVLHRGMRAGPSSGGPKALPARR